MIIVVAGGKQHGKDTFAEVLKDTFPDLDFHRAAFADKMKEVTAILLDCEYTEIEELKVEEDTLVTNPEVIIHGTTMRKFLQRLGQLMKDITNDQNIWCNLLGETLDTAIRRGKSNFVITDCRFPFEADYIREFAEFYKMPIAVVEISNPRVELGKDKHISEQSFKDIVFDGVILNDGEISDLKDQAIDLVETLERNTQYV